MNAITMYLLGPSMALTASFCDWWYWGGERADTPLAWTYRTLFCEAGAWDTANPECCPYTDESGQVICSAPPSASPWVWGRVGSEVEVGVRLDFGLGLRLGIGGWLKAHAFPD